MTIEFKNVQIKLASHGTLVAQPNALFAVVNEFFGLSGVSEIIGGRGMRNITVDVWISDISWDQVQPTKLFEELDRLDKLIGDNGTLEEKVEPNRFNGLNRKFLNCTFDGFTPVAIGSQETPSPLKDIGGSLYQYNQKKFNKNGGAWFMRGTLQWHQCPTSSTTTVLRPGP